jgi:hypothetical protein
MRIIAAITNSNPAIVTTTIDHLYLTGIIVRLDIFKGNGMPQANQQVGAIIVTGSTTFTIDIDTTQYDPFFIPTPLPYAAYTCSQVVPVGEVNSTLYAAVQNISPGTLLPSSYSN